MDWLIIVSLIIFGFILILLEVFALPGIIVGIIGVLSILIGIIYSFAVLDSNTAGLILFGTILFAALFTLLIFKSGVWRRFVLSSQQKREEGFTSAVTNESLVGQIGVALTNLRPSGSAMINDKKYDVLAEAEFLQKGDRIVVASVAGIKITVKKLSE